MSVLPGEPRCFDCGNKVDGYTPAGDGPDTPDAGSVSVCLYCGAVALFTGDGAELRLPTGAERAELDSHPQIIEVRRKCAQVRDHMRTGVAVLDQLRLPCGCVLTQALVLGEKNLLIEACDETCSNLADAITEARKQGKPAWYGTGSAAAYLAEQRRGAS